MSRTGAGRGLVNVVIVLAIVVVFVVALAVGLSRGDFGGTDAAATGEIARSDPDYEPWFEGLWSQPGGEVESGLFAMQAALGAGVLGFVLGSLRERRQRRPVAPRAAALPADADADADA